MTNTTITTKIRAHKHGEIHHYVVSFDSPGLVVVNIDTPGLRKKVEIAITARGDLEIKSYAPVDLPSKDADS